MISDISAADSKGAGIVVPASSTRLIDRAVQGTFEESPSSIQFQYVPILEPPMNDLN